ncbi:MAG: YHS domain-containing protein [Acidobacteria bacterium]|nr:YHS domain-containing protein [Acidobacteriota bacterium]
MNTLKISLLILFAAVFFAAFSVADCGGCSSHKADKSSDHHSEMKAGNQVMCPVMGNKINKDVYADYNGKRVYFCCAACIDKFNKDPEKYIKSLTEEGVEIADAPVLQELCPVTGNKINTKYHSDYKGKRVYFCSQKSKDAFDASPDKYFDKVKWEEEKKDK